MAAGLWALDHIVDRLGEDHRNARTLAEGLAELDGIAIDLSHVETNIGNFHIRQGSSQAVLARCRQQGVLGGGYVSGRVRFVTHFGISPADIAKTLAVCAEALAESA